MPRESYGTVLVHPSVYVGYFMMHLGMLYAMLGEGKMPLGESVKQ